MHALVYIKSYPDTATPGHHVMFHKGTKFLRGRRSVDLTLVRGDPKQTSVGNVDTQYLCLDTNEGQLDTELGVYIPATNSDTFGQKIQLLLATFCPFYCPVVVSFFVKF